MASDFAKLNSTITDVDLDAAWQDRSEDAASLDAGGRHESAITARLYALEIYLKFRICQRLGLGHPPKKLEIHDLEALLVFSGLKRALDSPSPNPETSFRTGPTFWSTRMISTT